MIFGNSLPGASSPLTSGQVSGQVRPMAKLAPHLHKIFAIVFKVTHFVKGVHIMDPKYFARLTAQ